MTEKNRRIRFPQYLKSFKCIGSTCEDSCCVGWKVDIDHETYKKYQKVRDEELAPLFNQFISRNRTSNKVEANFAKVKLIDGEKCPFLDEEMLCRIQMRRGEEYLSDVCTTYPRMTNTVNGVLERSASVSCPEAARLALLNPDPMVFDEAEEARTSRNIVKVVIKTDDLKLNNKPLKYLLELRDFTIKLLQNRNYPISERMIILGMFFQNIEQTILTKEINDIPGRIVSYTNIVNEGSIRDSLSTIPVLYAIQMKLLKEMTDKRYFMGVTNKRYLECFSEFLTGIQYTAESKVEEIGQRYHEASEKYYEPFMNEHEYILENYLVNHAFKNMVPFTEEKSLFDSYMKLVLHYSLIKMHLIGMAGFHKGMTEELVIKLIQSFAKTVEHHKPYIKGIAELMRQNEFNTMAYMAILIKN